MSQLKVTGSNGPDEISTNDLYNQYFYDGFIVEGLAGDDILDASFVGRNGVDLLMGGDGDDFLAVSGGFSPLPITNYLVASGGLGTDSLTMIGAPKLLSPGFFINEYLITFDLQTAQSDLINISVSTDVEFLAFTTDDGDNIYYLTEDLYYGRNRQAPWIEVWSRTYNENSDWHIKGLDTYSQYHSPPASQTSTRNKNVHRLLNPSSGRYLFSSNNTEIDILTGLNWIDEGITYKSPATGGTDLHRYMLADGSGHFYTANNTEKQILDNSSLFAYEGVAFKVYAAADEGPNLVPVVRYFNRESGIHLYSTSTYEQSLLDPSSTWINEGIAWYGQSA